MLANTGQSGINSSPDKVRERLNANDLRGLKVQSKLLRQAISDFPVPKLSPAAEAQLYKDAVDKYCSEGGGFVESGSGAYQYVVKGEGGKYEVILTLKRIGTSLSGLVLRTIMVRQI